MLVVVDDLKLLVMVDDLKLLVVVPDLKLLFVVPESRLLLLPELEVPLVVTVYRWPCCDLPCGNDYT